MELPHILGSTPLAFFISSRMVKLSFCFCSPGTVLMKSSTLTPVGLVFISATFDLAIDAGLHGLNVRKTYYLIAESLCGLLGYCLYIWRSLESRRFFEPQRHRGTEEHRGETETERRNSGTSHEKFAVPNTA